MARGQPRALTFIRRCSNKSAPTANRTCGRGDARAARAARIPLDRSLMIFAAALHAVDGLQELTGTASLEAWSVWPARDFAMLAADCLFIDTIRPFP